MPGALSGLGAMRHLLTEVKFQELQWEGVGGALHRGSLLRLEINATHEDGCGGDTQNPSANRFVVLERLSTASRWRQTVSLVGEDTAVWLKKDYFKDWLIQSSCAL